MSASTRLAFSDQGLIPDRALRPSDTDAFDHAAIVENLANHVERGGGPLNIALYGPWGSGKSSAYEMLVRRLEPRAVKPVRYDAWRFGGESLQRNFISHAANALGFDEANHRQYHDGLFEGRRHADVDLTDLEAWRAPMAVFSIVLVLLLCVVTVIALGVSFLTDRGPLAQIGVVLAGFFIPAAVGSLVVAAIKAVLDGATVTVEQSRPSSEDQFGRRFERLVTDARAKHNADRILFFVDELDRCAPDDVVATLTAIKTFLDRDDCVFVVAADRQVLEAALKSHLAQATPVDEDHPYYSSASAFLDKVFHHQMYLPPLRPVSLTRFARDLVRERGGVWEEIRGLGGQKLLDDVVYALVPSHVVSPRRVKVLLNNFASNVRITAGRHLYWESRVLEIAKLTVLQTEFPNLAHDLPDAPSLPDLLLRDDQPDDLTPTVRRLLARHALGHGEDAAGAVDALPPTAEPPDVLIVDQERSLPTKTRAVEVTQKRDLRRYLERCQARGIVSPKRDLLYLGTLGPTYGLGDSGLAEQLETDAREVPARVAAALKDHSREEREAAAKILGDLSRHEFGAEQTNCITSMLAAADISDLSEPTAARLVTPLDEALSNGNVADGDLAAALTVALASDTDEGRKLSGRIVSADALLDDPKGVERIAPLLHRLPRGSRPAVVAAIAGFAPEHPSVLVRALEALPDGVARELLGDDEVDNAVTQLASDDSADDGDTEDVVADLYAAVENKPQAAQRLQWSLIRRGLSYRHVREHADDLLASIRSSAARTSHAIRGVEHGPPEDWAFWSAFLDADAEGPDWWERTVPVVAARVVAAGDDPAVAARLAPLVGRLSLAEMRPVLDELQTRLSSIVWWTDRPTAEAQGAVYLLAQELCALTADEISSAAASTIEADFDRQSGTPLDSRIPNSPTMFASSQGLLAVGAVAQSLPPGLQAKAQQQAVEVLSQGGETDVRELTAHAVVALTRAIADAGGSRDVPQESAVIGALRYGQQSREIVGSWLGLNPRPATLAALASTQRHEIRAPIQDALTDWATRADERTRTDTIAALLDTDPPREAWIDEIARHGVDELHVIDDIRSRVKKAPRAEDRRRLAMVAPSLRPADVRTRRAVGHLIVDLLGQQTQGDLATAMKLIPSLGRDHQSGTAIKEAIDTAWDADPRLVVSWKDLGVLRAAGIEPKKRNWSEDAKKRDNKAEAGTGVRGIVERLTRR